MAGPAGVVLDATIPNFWTRVVGFASLAGFDLAFHDPVFGAASMQRNAGLRIVPFELPIRSDMIKETVVINSKITAAGFVFAFALAGAASAPAKDGAARAGYDARAQAIGEIGAAPARAEAIRACNEQSNKLVEYSWGNENSDRYRACMAERGQAE